MAITFSKPLDFREAVDNLRGRGIMPTTLSSADLARLDVSIRRESFFSARTPYEAYLSRAHSLIGDLVAGNTDTATVRTQLKNFLDSLNYVADTPDEEGTLTDLRSDRRLNLIIDTNARMAQSYGTWRQGQDPAILDMWPAQELYRASGRRKTRDWPERWRAAGGETFDNGRMVALKNDSIWTEISDFDLPYPPFAYGSGMGVRDVDRATAVKFGLIDDDTRIKPLDRDFTTAGEEDLPVQNRQVFLLNSRVFKRDALGRFAADGGPLSRRDNIKRGGRAIGHALRHQRDVPNAMNVRGLGRVDFVWGRPGHNAPMAEGRNKGKTHTDGFGLSHIAAKHPQDIRHLPYVLTHGKVVRHPEMPHRRIVSHGNYIVAVDREPRKRERPDTWPEPKGTSQRRRQKARLNKRRSRYAWVVTALEKHK